MCNSYALLVGLCIGTIAILLLAIVTVSQKTEPLMRWLCVFGFIFSITRYLTLTVYGDTPTLTQLEGLRYFYLATSIGLTVPFASVVWYVTPNLREKCTYSKYLLCFVPWLIFYMYTLITQPTEIVKGTHYGYVLELTGSFTTWLGIAQGAFVLIMLGLCIGGFIQYKNSVLRSKYFVLILALTVLTMDGILQFVSQLTLLPPFTLSEGLAFLAITYAFSGRRVK